MNTCRFLLMLTSSVLLCTAAEAIECYSCYWSNTGDPESIRSCESSPSSAYLYDYPNYTIQQKTEARQNKTFSNTSISELASELPKIVRVAPQKARSRSENSNSSDAGSTRATYRTLCMTLRFRLSVEGTSGELVMREPWPVEFPSGYINTCTSSYPPELMEELAAAGLLPYIALKRFCYCNCDACNNDPISFTTQPPSNEPDCDAISTTTPPPSKNYRCYQCLYVPGYIDYYVGDYEIGPWCEGPDPTILYSNRDASSEESKAIEAIRLRLLNQRNSSRSGSTKRDTTGPCVKVTGTYKDGQTKLNFILRDYYGTTYNDYSLSSCKNGVPDKYSASLSGYTPFLSDVRACYCEGDGCNSASKFVTTATMLFFMALIAKLL